MENESKKELEIENIKYQTYRANEISEIQTTSDGRDEEYIVATFEVESDVISQLNDYTKVFFENTHGVAFKRGNKARENNNPESLRIDAAKINAECPPYKFKDKQGKEQTASRIGLFLLRDEDVKGAHKRAIRNLDFVEFNEENVEAEESKAEALSNKK